MAKRLVAPDYYNKAKTGVQDTHHAAVLAVLEDRLSWRDAKFQMDVYDYVNEWRDNQRAGYEGNNPQQIALAAIFATAIRHSMRR